MVHGAISGHPRKVSPGPWKVKVRELGRVKEEKDGLEDIGGATSSLDAGFDALGDCRRGCERKG